jgi:hypothetical protein
MARGVVTTPRAMTDIEGGYVALQSFLNAFPRSPEYISLYIDSKLRKELSTASDSQADEALDKVLQIFRCAPVDTSPAFGTHAN